MIYILSFDLELVSRYNNISRLTFSILSTLFNNIVSPTSLFLWNLTKLSFHLVFILENISILADAEPETHGTMCRMAFVYIMFGSA